MKLSVEERQESLERFNLLKQLINERQAFEKQQGDLEPYKSHPTTMTFPDIDGCCLLQRAAQLGLLDQVKQLVELHHVSVSHQMPYADISALFIALNYENIEIARYLISRGATIDDCQRFLYDSPEVLAIYDEQAKLYLDNAKAKNALFSACLPNAKKSYLDLAAEIGDISSLIYASEQQDLAEAVINRSNSGENLILHRAVENSQLDTVAFILCLGIPINAVDNYMCTALHLAAKQGDRRCLNYLLQCSANVNVQDNAGKTPLYYAIHAGKEDCVSLLLSYGADPFITTYTNETIFHAQANSQMNLESLLEQFPELLKLAQQKDIYGNSPLEYNEANELCLNQSDVKNKIRYYLALNYRDNNYFSQDGYCNGFSFLFHYYDSLDKRDQFQAILTAWIKWGGTRVELQEKPDAPLDNYATINELFEEFLGHLTLFQLHTVPALNDFIRQHDRENQLALVSKTRDIHYILRDTLFVLDRNQLAELLSIFSRFPANTRFEIGGESHKTVFKVTHEGKFVYFDSNQVSLLAYTYDFEFLADLIINTKYKMLEERKNWVLPRQQYIVNFMIYYYRWEHVPFDNFNYFLPEELPQTLAEAELFRLKSPNSFNHLHIAILTHSKENLQQLIQQNYCDINQLTSLNWTPLKLAYQAEDSELYTLLLRQNDINLALDAHLLIYAYLQENKKFIATVIAHGNNNSLSFLLESAAEKADYTLVKYLLERGKPEEKGLYLNLIVKILNNPHINHDIKLFVYQYYKDISDNQGNTLAHKTASCANAFKFVLSQGSPSLHHKNKLSKTAIQIFYDYNAELVKVYGPESNAGQATLLIIQNIPARLGIESGFNLLQLLHYFPSAVRKIYAPSICDAMGNKAQLVGSSFFQVTLLEYFACLHDAVIVRTLLERMNGRDINHQHGENKRTALHYALLNPANTEERQNERREIVRLLIAYHANLDLADAQGQTARQLISQDAMLFADSPSLFWPLLRVS